MEMVPIIQLDLEQVDKEIQVEVELHQIVLQVEVVEQELLEQVVAEVELVQVEMDQ